MSELPDKSSCIPTFRYHSECPVAQLHLLTFGDAGTRKKCIENFNRNSGVIADPGYALITEEELEEVLPAILEELGQGGNKT